MVSVAVRSVGCLRVTETVSAKSSSILTPQQTLRRLSTSFWLFALCPVLKCLVPRVSLYSWHQARCTNLRQRPCRFRHGPKIDLNLASSSPNKNSHIPRLLVVQIMSFEIKEVMQKKTRYY